MPALVARGAVVVAVEHKDGSAVLFGAWPCAWDVDFKLAAPMATTVEGVFKDGKVQSLVVTPESRAKYVHVYPCQDV